MSETPEMPGHPEMVHLETMSSCEILRSLADDLQRYAAQSEVFGGVHISDEQILSLLARCTAGQDVVRELTEFAADCCREAGLKGKVGVVKSP